MNDQDIKLLMELAKKLIHEKTSKEEALRSLQLAGILDKDGKLTSQYKDLEVPQY